MRVNHIRKINPGILNDLFNINGMFFFGIFRGLTSDRLYKQGYLVLRRLQ